MNAHDNNEHERHETEIYSNNIHTMYNALLLNWVIRRRPGLVRYSDTRREYSIVRRWRAVEVHGKNYLYVVNVWGQCNFFDLSRF